MFKRQRIFAIKKLLDLIDHKIFNTRFARAYKHLFSHISSKNMVIFDVGSHEGEFLALFRQMFAECQLHAFEPDEVNFETLEGKFGKMSDIHLNPFGIGDTNEQKQFYRNVLSYTSSYKEIDLNSEWTQTKSRALGVTPEELIISASKVEMKTLDRYAEERKVERIHILKIDAEGYELRCLEGGRNLLKDRRIDSIQLEIHIDDMYKNHYSLQDIEEILLPYGYRLHSKKKHYLLKCQECIYTLGSAR